MAGPKRSFTIPMPFLENIKNHFYMFYKFENGDDDIDDDGLPRTTGHFSSAS